MKLVRQILTLSIISAMVTWFCGGLAMFPDAPIHPCAADRPYLYSHHPYGYCGKQGQSHTAIDFHNFNTWQNVLFWIWPPGMLCLVLLNINRLKR
jgi:hypothetical protein